MTRLTLILSAAVLLLVAAFPFAYAEQRHKTYRNLRVVQEGVLYRSGQMSAAGMARVCREKGVRTVISLRDEDKQSSDVDDEEAVCRRAGVEVYVTIPPKGWERVDGVVPMRRNLDEFAADLDAVERDVATGELRPKYPRPILVHCFAGIHRTGAHVAVYRVKYHGYTPDEALAELKGCAKWNTTYVGNLVPFLRDEYLPELAGRAAVGGPAGGR